MREIKFRAWVEFEPEISVGSQLGEMLYDVQNGDTLGDTFADVLNSPRCTVMQYTGLKDKNGKEIYELDKFLVVDDVIVETIGGYPRTEPEGIIKEIKFERGAFWWGEELLDEYAQYGEVVGNAFEGDI